VDGPSSPSAPESWYVHTARTHSRFSCSPYSVINWKYTLYQIRIPYIFIIIVIVFSLALKDMHKKVNTET